MIYYTLGKTALIYNSLESIGNFKSSSLIPNTKNRYRIEFGNGFKKF